MDLASYQQAALKTVQSYTEGTDPVIVPMLGMLGEAGSLATAYKKLLRDGPAHQASKTKIREEIGDVLWYLAILADRFGLDLNDVAAANIAKITDRWRPTPSNQIVFDEHYRDGEQLPRHGRVTFILELDERGRKISRATFEGAPMGDPLTDASHVEDSYRFHDAFHIAFATVLGWSPVMRSLLKRKRRSNPEVDEAEDGGRAIAIEEGISALVFTYAAQHNYLDGVRHLDQELLQTINGMVAHFEVSARRAADWEKAILTGFTAWRQLAADNGGTIEFDMAEQSLAVL